MSGLGVIIAGVIAFTLIVLALVAVILGAKATLVPSGNVTIEINGDSEKTLSVPTGGKLINTLAEKNIFIPSACGGGGTCGQCKVRVLSGGGEILPTEASVMTRKEIKNHVRLACQTPVKQDMKIEIPPEIFSVKKWECTVLSNESVATFIKELVLKLPEGESVDFKAGGYVQVERPAGLRIKISDYDIPETYRQDWIDMKLWDRESYVAAPISRAYSMASHPGEKGVIKFNIRFAFPKMVDRPDGKGKYPDPNAPVGEMSSYLFMLKPGDKITVSGPYGEFFIRENDREKVYIGRGVGMAPLRSHIFDMLTRLGHKEKISYWYSARTMKEAFYVEDFRKLEKEYPNFTFHLALYKPRAGVAEDQGHGPTGLIDKVIYEAYLKDHKAPEDCEYFMCGSPDMTSSVLKVLEGLGVERENVFFDDFG
ncbi:MAG: NADH:ubiquinone reductase (Na(+)-transporting) subunit F [Thermoguttaceae bacterium]|nr:NADH:ubiquinone reductase (Na(+)-transporting) subunit F [Thermoguttaceae bacterium]